MGSPQFEATSTEGVWMAQADSLGPTVAIIGGVHGDEPTGFEVVRQSLDALHFDTGTVILMLGNLAAEGKARLQDMNLNRSFRALTAEEEALDSAQRPYEVNRAQELLPYLRDADAALDLHDFTYPCTPFIICEEIAQETAVRIGAPLISFGWSSIEPGGTDGFMYEQGKEGLCYELGQKTQPKDNLERGHGAVTRFLIAQEMLYESLPPLFEDKPKYVEVVEACFRTSQHFKLARDFTNFEPLQEDELIAVDGGKRFYAQDGEVIIFPDAKAAIGTEAFLLGITM